MTGQEVNPWLRSAKNIEPAPLPDDGPTSPPPPVFVSAHGGAGATSWAAILGGVDGGSLHHWTGESAPVVLVARATLDGVDAAKQAMSTHGAANFACVLMVASAPGKPHRMIANELKVLSGGVLLVPIPWEPGLLIRRAPLASSTDIPPKELTKIITGLTEAGVTIQGETS